MTRADDLLNDALSGNSQARGEDEPLSVVAFPSLSAAALVGLPGKIVEAVTPHTEAHPAAILLQYLARFGCEVGRTAHVYADNREHHARINTLIVGKTSDGAKGTSDGVVSALYRAANGIAPSNVRSLWRVLESAPLRRVAGLSSGEGLIEIIRDPNGDDPDAKGYDAGVDDKRLLVVESEFTATLAVMERQGSILPRIVREAWDGDTLSTLTRNLMQASAPHVTIVGHCTPGELRIRLRETQLLGGTMNRFVPIASRRTKLLPDGGNIPGELTAEYGPQITDTLARAKKLTVVERSEAAHRLWSARYAELRKARPDGPVASMLARAAPQVLRLSLVYALADGAARIEEEHLTAAYAIWDYACATAEWMFGAQVDSGEVEDLVKYIFGGGVSGRTRTDISVEHFKRHKPAAEITAMLTELLRDGRIRQETSKPPAGGGRSTTRYFG